MVDLPRSRRHRTSGQSGRRGLVAVAVIAPLLLGGALGAAPLPVAAACIGMVLLVWGGRRWRRLEIGREPRPTMEREPRLDTMEREPRLDTSREPRLDTSREPLRLPDPSLLLLVLPLLIGASLHSAAGGIGLFSLYIVASVVVFGVKGRLRTVGTPAALLAVPAILTWSRPNDVPLDTVVLFALIGVAVVTAVAAQRDVPRALMATMDGAGLLLLAMVVGYALGLRSPADSLRQSGLGNILPLFGERYLFPFSTSLNINGGLAAAYFASVIGPLLRLELLRGLRLLGLGAATIVMLASGGRAALVLALGVAVVALMVPDLLRRIMLPSIAALIALPFVVPRISDTAILGGWLASERVAEIARLNNRDYIWSSTLEGLRGLERLELLWGFGARGHDASGIASTYSGRFGGLGVDVVSPHNSILQLLTDAGLLGTVAWVLAVAIVGRRLVLLSRHSAAGLAGLAFLCVLCLTGATEVGLAPGWGHASWWSLVAFALLVADPPASDRPTGIATPRARIGDLAGSHVTRHDR